MKTLYIDHDLLKYCTQKCIIKTKGKNTFIPFKYSTVHKTSHIKIIFVH